MEYRPPAFLTGNTLTISWVSSRSSIHRDFNEVTRWSPFHPHVKAYTQMNAPNKHQTPQDTNSCKTSTAGFSFSSTANPEGSCFGRRSNYCLKVDTVSHKPTSGAWQSGEIMMVLCQVQSLSLLPWAWSLMHLWPINTARVNITVCCCNLCLRLVNPREELRDMQYILHFLQDFFFPQFFFFLPRQKILFTGCHFKEGFEECAAEHGAIYVGFCSWKVYLDVIWYSRHSLCESRPFTVALPGVERKRELECYRSPDKDCSHCQVSRPGQLNTGGDPSTYAHPWDRDLEKRDGNRGGVSKGSFQAFLSLEAADLLKKVQGKQHRVQQDIIFSFAADVQAPLLWTIIHEWQRMSF